jgi:hypothetical protein
MDDILQRRVEWLYAFDRSVAGSGKVIGYCDVPQVLIETEGGHQVWWRRDLTRDVTCPHCDGTGYRKGDR